MALRELFGDGAGGRRDWPHDFSGQHPFRTTQDTRVETRTFVGIYSGSYHSRVSQMVQDFVHSQYQSHFSSNRLKGNRQFQFLTLMPRNSLNNQPRERTTFCTFEFCLLVSGPGVFVDLGNPIYHALGRTWCFCRVWSTFNRGTAGFSSFHLPGQPVWETFLPAPPNNCFSHHAHPKYCSKTIGWGVLVYKTIWCFCFGLLWYSETGCCSLWFSIVSGRIREPIQSGFSPANQEK